VTWRSFERAAPSYEEWYSTARGRRVDRVERALIAWLLEPLRQAAVILEVGCGSGHFARWLDGERRRAVGLDRSPAMARELRRLSPSTPVIVGEAHRLPCRDGAVDVVLFVTTLEFLEDPQAALREAVRVARLGVVVVALNRWSLGALSRRWGRQSGRPLLSQAHDYSVTSLRRMLVAAGGSRLGQVRWSSALFPWPLGMVRATLPVGDVIGIAATLVPSAS